MALRSLDRVWDPEAPSNADGFFLAEGVAVLLDGAAPRGAERVSAYANDTVWLVRRFLEEFAAASSGAPVTGDVRARVEAARALLKREYGASCAAARAVPAELPFACLAIAELARDRFELVNMGDLTTLVRLHDGSLQRFGESAVRELDRRALSELRRHLVPRNRSSLQNSAAPDGARAAEILLQRPSLFRGTPLHLCL